MTRPAPMVCALREHLQQAGVEVAAFDRLMGGDHVTLLAALAFSDDLRRH